MYVVSPTCTSLSSEIKGRALNLILNGQEVSWFTKQAGAGPFKTLKVCHHTFKLNLETNKWPIKLKQNSAISSVAGHQLTFKNKCNFQSVYSSW